MAIEWNTSYCVGDAQVDTQHQRLFVLANEILLAETQSALKLCFINLDKYTREHFVDEEALMLKVYFPERYAHAALHDCLVGRLNAISIKIGEGQWDPYEVESFMEHWLLMHILLEDSKLVQYVQRQLTRRNSLEEPVPLMHANHSHQ